MLINRWMGKEGMRFIIMEYYSVIKKQWNNAICSNMGEPKDYYAKLTQTERQIWYHVCGI